MFIFSNFYSVAELLIYCYGGFFTVSLFAALLPSCNRNLSGRLNIYGLFACCSLVTVDSDVYLFITMFIVIINILMNVIQQ